MTPCGHWIHRRCLAKWGRNTRRTARWTSYSLAIARLCTLSEGQRWLTTSSFSTCWPRSEIESGRIPSMWRSLVSVKVQVVHFRFRQGACVFGCNGPNIGAIPRCERGALQLPAWTIVCFLVSGDSLTVTFYYYFIILYSTISGHGKTLLWDHQGTSYVISHLCQINAHNAVAETFTHFHRRHLHMATVFLQLRPLAQGPELP